MYRVFYKHVPQIIEAMKQFRGKLKRIVNISDLIFVKIRFWKRMHILMTTGNNYFNNNEG